MSRRGDADLIGEPQGDLLLGFPAVVVGLLGKLGDGEAPMLIDDRRLRLGPAKGRTGREDALKVVVLFLIPEKPLDALKQRTQFDQGGNADPGRRLKCLLAQ